MRILLFFPFLLFGVSDEYVFRAVDPVLPIDQVQFENDYSPLNAHTSGMSNILYVKPLLRIDPNSLMPLYQGIRFQFQLLTTPYSSTTQETTNLGDTQWLDLFLWKGAWWEVGIGPMAIFPTALKTSTGQGKWQLGPALGFFLQLNKTQLGLLAQNPISFAGNSHRPDQNYLLFQPYFFQHLGSGWYLIANPQWTLDWLHHNYKIPLNFGAGRVFGIGRQMLSMNLRAEGMAYESVPGYVPEWTVQFLVSFLFE